MAARGGRMSGTLGYEGIEFMKAVRSGSKASLRGTLFAGRCSKLKPRGGGGI